MSTADEPRKTPRTRRGGRLAAAAVAVLLVTTACGKAAQPPDLPEKHRSSADGADAKKTALAAAARNLAGLISSPGQIICSSSDGGWQATAYDDTFRTRVAAFSVDALSAQLTEIAQQAGGERAFVRDLCGDEGDAGISPVSPDGRRVAVQVDFPDSGTPTHVGWLDLGTGAFTDITERSTKRGYVKETFSDEQPGFAPDGSFWFLRDSQEFLSADVNGRLSTHQISLACFRNTNEETFYRPVKSAAVMCPGTVHPSGTFAADPRNVAVRFSSVAGFELDVLADRVDRFADGPIHSPFSVQVAVRDDGELRDCTPVAWVNATDLLCAGSSNDFYTVRIDPAAARADLEYAETTEVGVKAEIAPATETTIVSIAVSRDRQSLIIAAGEDAQAGTAKLYRASLTSPADPVEIGPVPAGAGSDFTLLGNFQKIDGE
ncbi:hypothetical protein OHA77_33830 [Streptosporangium sp. NBC_01639]|uniref:hypothetical protein n=1 Tax=Streptosporangium sp. NBC_01639 TaxID=2975948 RepID=UPI00386E403D|nr:hypothetical protein OHA77_33830 [Streptosporangium sp. NBC_01639]